MIDGWGILCEIVLMWMSLDFTDDLSTLVQVITWCRQATSHYLNHCWPRSLTPYAVTRPQWVNSSRPSEAHMRNSINFIGSDSGLWSRRRQAIIWTNTGILLIRISGTIFIEILSEIYTFSLIKRLNARCSKQVSKLPFTVERNRQPAYTFMACSTSNHWSGHSNK